MCTLADSKNFEMKSIIQIFWIVLIFMFSVRAYAQIETFTAGCIGDSICYIDIIPDKNLTAVLGGSPVEYNIDVDTNGINDFKFYAYRPGGLGHVCRYFKIIPYGHNRIALGRVDTSGIHIHNTDTTYRYVARIFNYGDTIHEELTFVNRPTVFAELDWWEDNNYTFNIQDWVNIGEKYVGCMILRNHKNIYCWIKVNVYSRSSIMIKEHAVNIGYSLGIEEEEIHNNKFKIYPNPANDFIIIENNSGLIKNYTIEIFNNLGQTILQNNCEKHNKLYKIGINQIKPGLYYLSIKCDEIEYSSKLIIQ